MDVVTCRESASIWAPVNTRGRGCPVVPEVSLMTLLSGLQKRRGVGRATSLVPSHQNPARIDVAISRCAASGSPESKGVAMAPARISPQQAVFDLALQVGVVGVALFLVLVGLALWRSWLIASERKAVVHVWPVLVLSVLVLGVLLLQLGGIRLAAGAADDAARLAGLGGLRWSFVVHGACLVISTGERPSS